jgi:maltooligosyltrehalose trehalohydrolase
MISLKPLGAAMLDARTCRFRVWGPLADSVDLILHTPETKAHAMQLVSDGYYELTLPDVPEGAQYTYRINGQRELPDPASRYQPGNVHGPSQVVSPHFDWTPVNWNNIPLRDYIFYELHVGTFTPEGTFDAIIPHLEYLKDLGITAIEIMPVGQFPGTRNWGYDGVLPYAVQNSYGGPWGLKRLIDACHRIGLAVVLDVVYNHLGPEGNYLALWGPYFTDRYHSPWGQSLNFDGQYADEVRHYFIQNAIDFSAVSFLEALVASVQDWADQSGRRVYLIAEDDRRNVKVVRSQEAGGMGLDAQWLDDLHHCIHVHLTGQNAGYYEDYAGDTLGLLEKCLRDGFVYSGQVSPFRKRRVGTSSRGVPGHRFVVCTQNHDQVGNRLMGERLAALTDFDGAKLAAGLVILSPYLPLLFMGEEYAETAPFLFFTHFSDTDLIEAVRRGRAEEFAYFGATEANMPDPDAITTFEQSRLNFALRSEGHHRQMLNFYRALIHLRQSIPALRNLEKDDMDVARYGSVIVMRRQAGDSGALVVFNLDLADPVEMNAPVTAGIWTLRLASSDAIDAPVTISPAINAALRLPPKTFVVYVQHKQEPQ